MPPRIGVLFELLHGEAIPGETFCVTGGGSELGNWTASQDPNTALELRTTTLNYPRWTISAPIWLEFEMGSETLELEYKYTRIRRGCDQVLKWEDGIVNRRASLTCAPGSVWLVRDAAWNNSSPSAVLPMSAVEIMSMRKMLDNTIPSQPAGVQWVPSTDGCLGAVSRQGSDSSVLLTPRITGNVFHEEFQIEREFEACWSPHSKKLADIAASCAEPEPEAAADYLSEAKKEIAKLRTEKTQMEEEITRLRCLLAKDSSS
mmetsp:Transcript_87304/g.154732  ORF Transcript_87304/g.154732 Transcript_87304/m.154732 type:complete len:260 (-) Transcript_87304:108-887(-)